MGNQLTCSLGIASCDPVKKTSIDTAKIQEETSTVVSELRSRLKMIPTEPRGDPPSLPGKRPSDKEVNSMGHVTNNTAPQNGSPDHESRQGNFGNSNILSKNKAVDTKHKDEPKSAETMGLMYTNRELSNEDLSSKSQQHTVHIHMGDMITYNFYTPPKKNTEMPRFLCNLICDETDANCFCEI